MSTAKGGGKIVTDGLILYYDGANPQCYISGDTICNDLSITQSSGTLTNGVTYDTDNNGIWVFDGIDDYIEISDNENFNLERTNNMSLSGWVKFDSFDTFNQILSKYNHTINRGIILNVTSLGEIRFDLQNTGGANGLIVQSVGAAVILDEWTYVSITYDVSSNPTGIKLYKNGILLTNDTPIANTLSATIINAETVKIGRLSSFYMDAKVAQIKWWNRELTQGEITQNYNAMKSRFNL